MALSIDVQQLSGGRAARLRLKGDLDIEGARVARRRLDSLFGAGRVDVTINLDLVGFLDSAGLATLISALRQARDRGGDVRVETTNRRIRRVLEVTALAQVFKLQPDAA
jgi:anti-anti-sigma factor